MKKFFKKTKKKQWLFIGGFLFVFLFSFLIASPVEANWATQFFGWIFAAIVYILGLFLVLLTEVLIYIASYNNFLGVPAITVGWSMVRDLANMFFVVILLIIAFATILPGIEKYNYKKWLPKLILMAVLINFSKTICGLLIDVAQVVMLSFVSAFANISGTNITHMLGILDWHELDEKSGDVSGWEVMGAYFLAVVYVVISIVVIGAMLMMLVMRIVMIWIYVILSPLAFLLNSFPDGSGYASKWWKQFTQNLVIGPVLAFFIWLSFSIVSVDVSGTQVLGDNEGLGANLDSHDRVDEIESGDDHGFGSGDLMIQFIVSIGLLIGGLKVSQEIGGEAGNVLGKASQKGFGIAKQLGKKAAVEGTKFVGRQALGRGSKLAQKYGKEGSWLQKTGDIGQAWRGDIGTKRKKKKKEKIEKFLTKMGMGEQAGEAISKNMKEAGLDKKYEALYETTEEMGKKPRRLRNVKEHLEKEGNAGDISASDINTMTGGANKDNVETFVSSPTIMKDFEDWFKNEGVYKKGGGYSGSAADIKTAKAWQSAIKEGEEKKFKGIENAKGLKSILEGMDLANARPKDKASSDGVGSSETMELLKKLTSEISNIKGSSEKGGSGARYNFGENSKPNNDLADNTESSNINQGKLFTNSFASGDKDVMGISFDKLKADGADIETDATGVNLNPELMGANFDPFVNSLINQINQAQISLDDRKKSGEISDEEHKIEFENLSGAKKRIESGDFENINLVNTNHPKYGREMALRNAYHEELHSTGLDDEYLTKTIENSLMENKLYGKNSETGNRHATEIGELANKLKSEGKSDSEIASSVNKEIRKRSQGEASSRAERVLKLEKGELETESQAAVNIKKEKKKDSMVDVARERGLIKKQMDYYRKMIADGSSKDENGNYDESKVKVGEDGLKKMQDLTTALNKLDSVKQSHSSAEEKVKDYREKIKEAEKTGDNELGSKYENDLRNTEKEINKLNDDIVLANKEYNNKKESDTGGEKSEKKLSGEQMNEKNLKELDQFKGLDKKLKESISKSVIDNGLYGKKDKESGESYLMKMAKEVDSKKQRAKVSNVQSYSNKDALKEIQSKLKSEGLKSRGELDKEDAHKRNMHKLNQFKGLDKKLKEAISKSIIDSGLHKKEDKKTGESYLVKAAKEAKGLKEQKDISGYGGSKYSNTEVLSRVTGNIESEKANLDNKLNDFVNKIKQKDSQKSGNIISPDDIKKSTQEPKRVINVNEVDNKEIKKVISSTKEAANKGDEKVIKIIDKYNKTNNKIGEKTLWNHLKKNLDK